MFDFRQLIKLYESKDIYILEKSGYEDDFGQWIDGGVEETNIFGAVTRLNTDELLQGEGGTYNADDRKLYCYTKLDKGQKVKHRGQEYTVTDEMDYIEHDKPKEDDGLHLYYLKRGDIN